MTEKICAILLAGGLGTRLGGDVPKQFQPFLGKPLALHSFDLLNSCRRIDEVIVVCADPFRHLFPNGTLFAHPGQRRQDSVYHGLQQISKQVTMICIHDASRPHLDIDSLKRVLEAGVEVGAAALGMPLKFTVKECDPHGFVVKTPNRSHLWEIQTPQVIRRTLLEKGFDYAYQSQLDVTDDVSLVEAMGVPVKIVQGSEANIKITTPHDLQIAKQLLVNEAQL